MIPAATKEILMFCDGFLIDYCVNEMLAFMSIRSISKIIVTPLKTILEWD
jgi:hypothetical protein